jgi:hypothetical protein
VCGCVRVLIGVCGVGEGAGSGRASRVVLRRAGPSRECRQWMHSACARGVCLCEHVVCVYACAVVWALQGAGPRVREGCRGPEAPGPSHRQGTGCGVWGVGCVVWAAAVVWWCCAARRSATGVCVRGVHSDDECTRQWVVTEARSCERVVRWMPQRTLRSPKRSVCLGTQP